MKHQIMEVEHEKEILYGTADPSSPILSYRRNVRFVGEVQ